jgi:nicotinamidase/pyrazinamidase
MKKTKCLICVDLQQDFCPGGTLVVPNGDLIVPKINNLLKKFDLVIFTKDWHSPHMDAFASSHEGAKPFDKYINKQGEEDTLWPDHCVADTPGAEFHPDLDLSKCKKDFYIFKKGNLPDYHPYSGFGETGLKDFLDKKGVTETYIVGLATDYCVRDTAIDSALAGYDTYVIIDHTMSINPDLTETLNILKEAGVACADDWALSFLGNY